jgi:hypothetical protein
VHHRDNKSEHHLWDEERLAAIRAALGGRGREPAMALEGPSAAFLASNSAKAGQGSRDRPQHGRPGRSHPEQRIRALPLQLGVAALAFDTGSQTQASLRQTLTSTHRFTTLRGHERAVYGVRSPVMGGCWPPAAATARSGSGTCPIRTHPGSSGAPLVDGVEAASTTLRSPPMDPILAAHGDEKESCWDIRDPRARPAHRRPARGSRGPGVEAVLSPTGSVLAIAAQSGTVTLWDVADREHPRPLGGPIQGAANGAAAFSADGRVLANANGDNTITLWDVGDPGKPSVLAAPFGGMGGASVLSVALAGRTRAGVHPWRRHDTAVDAADRSAPWQLGQTLTGHTGTAVDVAFAGRTHAGYVEPRPDRDRGPHRPERGRSAGRP